MCGCYILITTNLIQSTHSGDGADVIGDGDQCCPGQVLFRNRLPLFFRHHVAETAKARQDLCLEGRSILEAEQL